MSKRTFLLAAASVAAAGLSTQPVHGQDGQEAGGSSPSDLGRFTLGTELGVSFLPSIKVKDYEPGAGEIGIAGVEAAVDAGVAWNVDVGYRINDWFGVEIESGYYRNGFGGFEGGEFFIDGVGATPIAGGDGSFTQIPLFLNAKFRLPLLERPAGADGGAIRLDLTAGLGAVHVSADIDGITAVGLPGAGTAAVDGGSWGFGGQFGVGVTWEVRSNVEIGLGYRLMVVEGANFGTALFSDPALVGVAPVETETVFTNAIQATLSIRF